MTASPKQAPNQNAPEQKRTLLSQCEKSTLREHEVLTLIYCLYQETHLRENALKYFAGFLRRSEKHITHCLTGSTHLGDEDWQVLIARCGSEAQEIRDEWLEELRRRYSQPTTDIQKEKK